MWLLSFADGKRREYDKSNATNTRQDKRSCKSLVAATIRANKRRRVRCENDAKIVDDLIAEIEIAAPNARKKDSGKEQEN